MKSDLVAVKVWESGLWQKIDHGRCSPRSDARR